MIRVDADRVVRRQDGRVLGYNLADTRHGQLFVKTGHEERRTPFGYTTSQHRMEVALYEREYARLWLECS